MNNRAPRLGVTVPPATVDGPPSLHTTTAAVYQVRSPPSLRSSSCAVLDLGVGLQLVAYECRIGLQLSWVWADR